MLAGAKSIVVIFEERIIDEVANPKYHPFIDELHTIVVPAPQSGRRSKYFKASIGKEKSRLSAQLRLKSIANTLKRRSIGTAFPTGYGG